MAKRMGEVMGLFAFGHPFLDGNGRAMLLIHLELSYRAGFSIAWSKSSKNNYLKALSDEINQPAKGILDTYLLQFKGDRMERELWGSEILAMNGLDGLDDDNQVEGSLSDPAIAEKYRKFELKRGYSYTSAPGNVCARCNTVPCICGGDGSSGPGF